MQDQLIERYSAGRPDQRNYIKDDQFNNASITIYSNILQAQVNLFWRLNATGGFLASLRGTSRRYSVVTGILVCLSHGRGFKSPPEQNFLLEFSDSFASSITISTRKVQCRQKERVSRERSCHPPTYAETKRTKSLTLHAHGCLSGLHNNTPLNLDD